MAASDPSSLGSRIKRARNLRRLSQRQLAAAVGVSLRTIGSWERDETEPQNLAVVEEFFGTSLVSSAVPPDPREEELRKILTGVVPDEEVELWVADYRTQRDKRRAG